MKLTDRTLQVLCDTALDAARAAGEYIEGVDRERIQRQHKETGNSPASQLVTEVDVRSEAIIREFLDASCIKWNIAFVGEESAQNAVDELPERLTRSHFWCVDPLDGTLPFVEGIPGYAVSIALVEQSGSPVIGVVYDPASRSVMHAIRGQGAYRNGAALGPTNAGPDTFKVYADASFAKQNGYEKTEAALNACAKAIGLEHIDIIYGGGAVKNACQVLGHAAACYIKLPKTEEGGGSIWDFAATACIAREAGAWVSNIQGEVLDLNRADSTFMNHQGVLFASSGQIARYLIEALWDTGRPVI